MRAVWRHQAIDDLEKLAERAPAQAAAVVSAVEWPAESGHPDIGRLLAAGLYLSEAAYRVLLTAVGE